MKQTGKKSLIVTYFVLLTSPPITGQTTITALLPEVDSYFRFSPNARLFFEAKGYVENDELNHGQIRPSLQFNTRPFEKLKRITIFELDDLQCMPVVFTIGQAYALKLTTELLEKSDGVAERSLKGQ